MWTQVRYQNFTRGNLWITAYFRIFLTKALIWLDLFDSNDLVWCFVVLFGSWQIWAYLIIIIIINKQLHFGMYTWKLPLQSETQQKHHPSPPTLAYCTPWCSLAPSIWQPAPLRKCRIAMVMAIFIVVCCLIVVFLIAHTMHIAFQGYEPC